ncbi:MAG: NADH-quinone oxidoreductase subunit L [Pseudomonadota bacterium]
MLLDYAYLIPLIPLAGAAANGLLGWRAGERRVGLVASAAMAVSFALALGVFLELARSDVSQRSREIELFTWIAAGSLRVPVAFLIDQLSAVMMLVVCGVGLLIHVYAAGYMHKDPGYFRFFTYLNLFVFAMLVLVMANNLLFMFVGWEGVGLCSYLLIGYYYDKDPAANAGKKAFVVNRIGDVGFLLAIFLTFQAFGSLEYAHVLPAAATVLLPGGATVTAITLLFFLGATGKSAQLPLYIWLPDAMEGPTPVSALIHAATMVTAGVYMVCRMSPFYVLAPVSLTVVAVVGGLTALYAASIGLVQNDLKRVLAYSTISQLGYMFLACGVGAFGAAIFHLVTHAFFKALLFLGAGSVMHALSGELDLRRMGGLRRHLPITYRTFLVATLAICGIFPFAGFFSKDAILLGAMLHGGFWFWAMGALAAFMTAFYMSRVLFLAFWGDSRLTPQAEKSHPHESPALMTFPLIILAVLSVVGGWLGLPLIRGGNFLGEWLAPVLAAGAGQGRGETPVWVELTFMGLALVISAGGILAAWKMYVRRPEVPARLARIYPNAYDLLYHKYYADEAVSFALVEPVKRLSTVVLWRVLDASIIDGLVNGVATVALTAASVLRRLQTGYVQNYALGVLAGAVAVVYWLVLR